jgi:hypothetical protein
MVLKPHTISKKVLIACHPQALAMVLKPHRISKKGFDNLPSTIGWVDIGTGTLVRAILIDNDEKNNQYTF